MRYMMLVYTQENNNARALSLTTNAVERRDLRRRITELQCDV
ncbi:MAG TPA: hypothetical protein VN749_19635 [Candidatus Eisenbacteria bacterium]|jgi:hypothetical protein|nr:hypothetical protein [Candidatus Eisenbacteria bacterium]